MLDLLEVGHSSPAACLRKCIKEIVQDLILSNFIHSTLQYIEDITFSNACIFWASNPWPLV